MENFNFAPQIILAISALLSTITGGLIGYLSNINLKLREWQLSLNKEDVSTYRKIYSDFLGEASKE